LFCPLRVITETGGVLLPEAGLIGSIQAGSLFYFTPLPRHGRAC
jgi:hypothetical protein